MSLSRLQWNLVHQAGRGLALTAAQHCHPVMASSAGGKPMVIICITCAVGFGSTRRLNVTLVSPSLFMEVSIRAALGRAIGTTAEASVLAQLGREEGILRYSRSVRRPCDDRPSPLPSISLSVSLYGSHYGRQNSARQRGDPQPLEMWASHSHLLPIRIRPPTQFN